MGYGFKIIVEGDYACFSRPEMKVERVSYDVPTPGALEGLIKSIYWKPSIRIVIDKIVVFNPIKFTNIRRNEKREKILLSNIKNQIKNHTAYKGEFTINQRTAMVLKDVKYGIEFHFELTNLKNEHNDECEEKHYNIMLRRLKNGQCFRQPCFGMKEFAVKSIKLVEDFPVENISPELEGDIDLGYMLYRMDFKDKGVPVNNDWENPVFLDLADPQFYRPKMINGVIDVKKYREGCVC